MRIYAFCIRKKRQKRKKETTKKPNYQFKAPKTVRRRPTERADALAPRRDTRSRTRTNTHTEIAHLQKSALRSLALLGLLWPRRRQVNRGEQPN